MKKLDIMVTRIKIGEYIYELSEGEFRSIEVFMYKEGYGIKQHVIGFVTDEETMIKYLKKHQKHNEKIYNNLLDDLAIIQGKESGKIVYKERL